MLVAQAHSFTQQARLAITLAWIAGYTNIVSILSCDTVTSHVSGTVSQWGRDWVEGRWGLTVFTSFLLATFLGGAMLSSVCTETGRRRGWQSIYVLPIVVQTLLLAGFAIGVELLGRGETASGATRYLMVGLASMAMGLQNATITRISGGVVRTTHMTGVFTDLGLEFVQFLYWLRDRHKNSPPLAPVALVHSVRVHPTARRLAVLLSVVGSFALGAGLGALLYDRVPGFSMFAPVLFLLWIVYADIRAPICEIEAIGGGEQPGGAADGLELPHGLAVYHLRKDRERKGKAQRLPDLLRWCDGLTDDVRVVILDLGEVTVLDSNAALELRALIRQSSGKGRKIVISGVNGEQYRTLRQAGAGDSLDPTNVCPDLELAIARGLMLIESREFRVDRGAA